MEIVPLCSKKGFGGGLKTPRVQKKTHPGRGERRIKGKDVLGKKHGEQGGGSKGQTGEW